GRLIHRRNEVAHQPWVSAGDALEERCDLLWGLLERLDFLSRHPLVVPQETDPADPRSITGMVCCMGCSSFEYESCQIEFPEDLGGGLPVTVSPVLLDESRRRVLLPLYPLHLFELGPSGDSDELFAYFESIWDGCVP